MTEQESITARRAAIWVQINAGPSKPSYTLGSKTVDWSTYQKSLYEELALLDARELKIQGPYIVKQVKR